MSRQDSGASLWSYLKVTMFWRYPLILILILSIVHQVLFNPALRLLQMTNVFWNDGLDLNHHSYHHINSIVRQPRQGVSKLRMFSFLLEDKEVYSIHCLLRLSALSGESDFIVIIFSYIVLNPPYERGFHFLLSLSASFKPQWDQRTKFGNSILSDFVMFKPITGKHI